MSLAKTRSDSAGNQQQREKKMVILLKIPEVTDLFHVSFSPMSAIANLRKPERSGEMLPITVREYSSH